MERSTSTTVQVVAFAASTGGPAALSAVLCALPRPFPAPILIVQHLPPAFTSAFAEQLAQASGLTVTELRPGLPLSPGTVIVAIGGQHMRVWREGGTVGAYPDQGPPENSCRPSADVLLRSVAQVFGAGALAVVLTGVGADGLAGCAAVRQAGGRVVVQDEETSVAWGMPGSVVRAGLAQSVLPLADLPYEISRHCGAPAAPGAGQLP